MKVLKDPGQVLQIMNRKLDELRKKFDAADGEEASEISGQEVSILDIAGGHSPRNRGPWLLRA